MSRAYFFSSAYKGCSYLRCLLPQLHGGYNGSWSSLYGSIKDPQKILEGAQFADIAVFHRPDKIENHKVAYELKKMGKKIVFDNDDTFKLSKGNPFFEKNMLENVNNEEKYGDILDNFIHNSDAVITTTEFLAKEYRELNDNVHVMPNCVDPDDWDEPKYNEGDKVRIALVGSVVYSHDFKDLKEYIKELDEDPRVQLVMFGLNTKENRVKNKKVAKLHEKEYEFWDSLENLEHVPWVDMKDYFTKLNDLKLDIMLIPRVENYFNKCKSNVKFLEAAMCEIPVIAQSFTTGDSPYDFDIDGENGLLAETVQDWMIQTEILIASKTIRRGVGKRAREYVLANYDIKDHAYKWEQLFNELTK